MRWISASVLLVVLTTALGFVPPASSAPRTQVIRLLWVQTSNHPNGKKNGSWTAQLLNTTREFGKPAGAKVGAEVGVSHGAQFVGGIKLPGGVLEYSGKVKHLPRDGISVPVVDGSGVFVGVTGTYTRSKGDKAHPNKTVVVLSLQYG